MKGDLDRALNGDAALADAYHQALKVEPNNVAANSTSHPWAWSRDD